MAKSWIEQGGGAFPFKESDYHSPEYGMSLRDYFAAQAIGPMAVHCIEHIDLSPNEVAEASAKAAYMLADAMLEARTK